MKETNGSQDTEPTPEGVVGDVVNAAKKTIGRLWAAKFVILALFLVGLLLVALRTALVHLAPKIEPHIKLWTEAWNVIADICEPLFATIHIVISALVDGVKFLEGKHNYKVLWPPPDGKNFKRIFVRDAMEILYTIPELCRDYGSANKIVTAIFYEQVGPRACEVVRSMYPTPLRNVSISALGWAVGDRDTAPFGENNGPGTCESNVAEMSMLCIPFESGPLILELLLPVLIGTIVGCSWLPVAADAVEIATEPVNKLVSSALDTPPPYNFY